MGIRAVIFDFDGPINDSFRVGLERLEHVVCRRNGIEVTDGTRRKVVELWGLPGAELIEKAFGVPAAVARELYHEWEALDAVGGNPVPLVWGARETLVSNQGRGIVNVLLTARGSANITPLLQWHGIERYFSFVEPGDRSGFSKPHPFAFDRPLGFLYSLFGIGRHECIYVGDTVVDVHCSVRAGVEILIVLTGPYRDPRAPLRDGVRRGNVLKSIAELPSWFERRQDHR